LNKTLGFINVDSRKSLIDNLKIICKTIDYPYSELSDDDIKKIYNVLNP
jgi:hypothetical protein